MACTFHPMDLYHLLQAKKGAEMNRLEHKICESLLSPFNIKIVEQKLDYGPEWDFKIQLPNGKKFKIELKTTSRKSPSIDIIYESGKDSGIRLSKSDYHLFCVLNKQKNTNLYSGKIKFIKTGIVREIAEAMWDISDKKKKYVQPYLMPLPDIWLGDIEYDVNTKLYTTRYIRKNSTMNVMKGFNLD